jgi:hypothetical protein
VRIGGRAQPAPEARPPAQDVPVEDWAPD